MTTETNWEKIVAIIFPSKEIIDGAYLVPKRKNRIYYLKPDTKFYPEAELSCYYCDAYIRNTVTNLSPNLMECVCDKLDLY